MMATTTMQVPDAVRELRSALRLTQEKFAARVRVSVISIQRWEAGSVRLKPSTLVALYQVAKEADRPDLATIFAFGHSPVESSELPGFRLAEALPHIRDYLARINLRLTKALCDPKLDQEKRSRLLGETISIVVDAEQFVERISKEARD